MPVSPVTGALDAFEWRVPVSELETADHSILGDELDGLIAIGEPVAADAATIVTRSAEQAPQTIDVEDLAPESQSKHAASRTDGRAARPDTPLPEPASQSARDTTKATRAPGAAPAKPAEPAHPNTQAPTADSARTEALRKPTPPRPPRIFTAPPAPDDPGTDADDSEPASPLRPYGV
jgi:HemY protein